MVIVLGKYHCWLFLLVRWFIPTVRWFFFISWGELTSWWCRDVDSLPRVYSVYLFPFWFITAWKFSFRLRSCACARRKRAIYHLWRIYFHYWSTHLIFVPFCNPSIFSYHFRTSSPDSSRCPSAIPTDDRFISILIPHDEPNWCNSSAPQVLAKVEDICEGCEWWCGWVCEFAHPWWLLIRQISIILLK